MNVTAIAETLGWILVHFTWQGLAIGLVMLLLLTCIRRDRSRIRYGVCCAGLLLLAIAPVLSGFYFAPTIEPAVTHVSPSVASSIELGPSTDAVVPEPPAEPGELLAGTNPSDAAAETETAVAFPAKRRPDWIAQARSWLPWVVGCWLAGVVLLMVRLLCGLHRVCSWRREGSEPGDAAVALVLEQLCSQMKVRQCVRLLESARATVPTVIGWLRPVVLVPTSMLTNLTAAELESILAHELAHIRRHDYAINLLQTVLETLLFFHPVVWWLSRQTRIEREHCCDDIAIAACGDRPALARALAKMEELRCENRQLVAANGGVLVTRIRRILQKDVPDSSGGPAGIVTLLAIVALVVTSALSVAGTSGAEWVESEDEEPIAMLPNEATDDDDAEDEETEDDNTYPVRKLEARKIDSKTGIRKSVFTDIRLTAWHADNNRERRHANVDMVYSNVFNYTFIPQRVATKLNATVLGEINFGEQAPVRKNLTGNAQLMNLLASAPDKSELQKKRLTVNDVKAPVGDEKVRPYASDATWIPGHLGFYGMNQTKQHVFKIVRLAKVNVGVGPPITNVNALVLADENSDFGVLGRNWSKRVRGKNGEHLWFTAEGAMHFMAGNDRSTDQLLANVHEFRVETWDDRLQQFVRVPSGEPLPSPPDVRTEAASPMKRVVQVFDDGTLQFDDAKLSIKELTDSLKALVLENPAVSLALRCDAESSYQSVTTVMEACRAAGVQDMSVEVRKAPGADNDDKGDNQAAASNPKWGNADRLNISGQMLESYFAESRSWGPVAKSSKLLARLSLLTKNPRAGEPLRLKLELRNSGTEPEQYDAQHYSAFHVLRVTNVATGKSDDFIGVTAQTAGRSVPLTPNATVTLWESMDAAELFMLNEGTYKIQIASPLKNGTLPASNELTVVVAAGRQPPTKRFLGELLRVAPKNWRVNKGWGGAFMVTHATSSVRESIAIQMWFTEEPLAADFQLGSGKSRQNVTTVGRFGTMGHLHIGAPPKVDELWPNHVRFLIQAARKTLTDKR